MVRLLGLESVLWTQVMEVLTVSVLGLLFSFQRTFLLC